jgi:hypothetical protein
VIVPSLAKSLAAVDEQRRAWPGSRTCWKPTVFPRS